MVIKNFSVSFEGGIHGGRKKSVEIPTTKIDGVIEDLQFRFTPMLYNYYMNIVDALDLNDEDGAWSELVRDKATIIKAMRMIGVVKKRGEGLKSYWYKYYCCLSGGYLYFYEANRQLYPSKYFYVKNAEVTDGLGEIGIENSLILRTKTDQCYLAFNTKEDWKNWKREIENVVQEISFLSEALYKKSQAPIDYTEVVLAGMLKVHKLTFEFLDEKARSLMYGELRGIECAGLKRRADIVYHCKISSMEMIDPNSAHYKRMLYSEGGSDLIGLDIEVLDKNSPKNKERLLAGFPENPRGQQLIYRMQFGRIVMNYPPKLIKRLTQIVLDLKLKKVVAAKVLALC